MGDAAVLQLLDNLKVLAISSPVLFMGVPGMPHLAFLSMSAILAGAAYFKLKKNKPSRASWWKKNKSSKFSRHSKKSCPGTMFAMSTPLVWKWGHRLFRWWRNKAASSFPVLKARKKQSQEFGFWVPAVYSTTGPDLNSYRITLMRPWAKRKFATIGSLLTRGRSSN